MLMANGIGNGVSFGGGSAWFKKAKFRAIDIADTTAKGPAAILDFRKGQQALTTVASGSIAGATTAQLTVLANDTYANALTFTRSSTATYIDVNGAMQTAAVNETRFDYSNGARQQLIEGASTNYVKNSDTTGAVVGVIGSGGTLPTSWAFGQNVAGITREITGKGIEFGLPYFDYKLSGTNTSGSVGFPAILYMNVVGGGANVAATTEAWTVSTYAKIISGSSPISPAVINIAERDSGGVNLSNVNSTQSVDTTFRKISITKNGGLNASTVSITGAFTPILAIGETVNVTYRIYGAQVEQLPFASSFIPTTATAVTRSADSALFSAKLLALINRANCTIVIKGRTLGLQPTGTLIGADNGVMIRQGTGTPSQVVAGEQAVPSLPAMLIASAILPGPFGIAYDYASGFRGVSANGSALTTDANTNAAKTTVSLGNAAGGIAAGYFLADQLIIYPFRATDAEVQRLAAAYV